MKVLLALSGRVRTYCFPAHTTNPMVSPLHAYVFPRIVQSAALCSSLLPDYLITRVCTVFISDSFGFFYWVSLTYVFVISFVKLSCFLSL